MITSFDDHRNTTVPGDSEETVAYCTQHFITTAQEAIKKNDIFTVALSGGSTPKKIFQSLAKKENRDQIGWTKVKLFWSDERAVPPTDPESNFKMAMDAGFSSIPIPKENIFRMIAEGDIEQGALDYEKAIQENIPNGAFDMVMLGMGDDGHTASLFPKTHGLHSQDRQVIANYIPQKETWRLSLTFKCINAANTIVLYVLGENKADMVKEALTGPQNPDLLPVQGVGSPQSKALWIMDNAAAKFIY